MLATETLLVAVVVLLAVACALLIALLLRRPSDPAQAVSAPMQSLERQMRDQERVLADEIARSGRDQREELAGSIGRMTRGVLQQMGTIAGVQNNQIDSFAKSLARLTEANDQRLGEIRGTLEVKLGELRQENAAKLDEMRRTVDEKLQSTLEQRLADSFRLVSERLESVHKGLGEMRALASNVGDLKRVLANVKTRGNWGEVQLAALLEQMLVSEQYARNVATVSGSSERVEFAIRLPGVSEDRPVWLPVDAKFPREDFERLVLAQENADATAAETASRQLATRLREEARKIRAKYLSPPETTDFAIMFLPTEGLYAEAIRRPGLVDELQRVHRVVVSGPTTLAAILSSLQMGFRTLAVERRSSEVWHLLGAVKTDFARFADVLARTKEQLDRASTTLGTAQSSTRRIEERLRSVESLADPAAAASRIDVPGGQ